MSKESREHLSSLMDGELSVEAGRFLTRRMGSDETLNATWRRYHLIRDCLRRPGESLALTRLTVDFERLDEGAADETTADTRAQNAPPGWVRPFAGMAIAASVAAAVILGVLQEPPGAGDPVAEPFTSPNTAGIAPSYSPANLSQPASYQGTLGQYLRRHNQATGAMGQQGMVIMVPVMPSNPVQVVDPVEDTAPTDGEMNDRVSDDDG